MIFGFLWGLQGLGFYDTLPLLEVTCHILITNMQVGHNPLSKLYLDPALNSISGDISSLMQVLHHEIRYRIRDIDIKVQGLD